jgi:hypothetical protein
MLGGVELCLGERSVFRVKSHEGDWPGGMGALGAGRPSISNRLCVLRAGWRRLLFLRHWGIQVQSRRFYVLYTPNI